MARYDNAYSRLVFWLKIVLPLAALGILSTIFLVAHTIDPSRAIPYAHVDVTELARESRITAPTYAGVTADGTRIDVIAASARPDANTPGRASASDITATMKTAAGAITRLTAIGGQIDTPANHMMLSGNVRMVTSSNFHIAATQVDGALDRTYLTATGGITAEAPMGTITSDRLDITVDPARKDSYLLVFKKDVKLVFDPGN